jgi:hypothetical protein
MAGDKCPLKKPVDILAFDPDKVMIIPPERGVVRAVGIVRGG